MRSPLPTQQVVPHRLPRALPVSLTPIRGRALRPAGTRLTEVRTLQQPAPAPAPVLVVTATPGQSAQLGAALAGGGLSNPVIAVHSVHAAERYLLGRGPWGDRSRHPLPAVVVTDLHLLAPVDGSSGDVVRHPSEAVAPPAPGICLLRLREVSAALRDVPIVVVGRHASDQEIELVHRLGAAAYLAESVVQRVLVDVIRGLGMRWVLAPGPGASCA